MNIKPRPIIEIPEYQLFKAEPQKALSIPDWKTVQNLSKYIPSSEIKASSEANEAFIIAATKDKKKLNEQINEKLKIGAYHEINAISKEILVIDKLLNVEKDKISKNIAIHQKIIPLKNQALLALKQADYFQAAKCYKQICDIAPTSSNWYILLNFANLHFTSLVPTLCNQIINNSFATDWLKESAVKINSQLSDQTPPGFYPTLKEDNGQLDQLFLRSQALQEKDKQLCQLSS